MPPRPLIRPAVPWWLAFVAAGLAGIVLAALIAIESVGLAWMLGL